MAEPRTIALMSGTDPNSRRLDAQLRKRGRPEKYATDAERVQAVKRNRRRTDLRRMIKGCRAKLERLEAELQEKEMQRAKEVGNG